MPDLDKLNRIGPNLSDLRKKSPIVVAAAAGPLTSQPDAGAILPTEYHEFKQSMRDVG